MFVFVLLVWLAFAFLKFSGQELFGVCCGFVVVFVLKFVASMVRCALIRAEVDVQTAAIASAPVRA